MRKSISSTLPGAALLLALGTSAAHAAPFAYHGNLDDHGHAAEGRFDLRISVFGSEQAAVPMVAPVTLYDVDVHEGSFSAELDLDDSVQRGGWIAVEVRPSGGGDFAASAGREALAPAGACPAAWSLNGNAGIAGTNYLGTSDGADLVFKVDGVSGGRFHPVDGGPSFTSGAGHADGVRGASFNFGYADASYSFAAGYSGVVLPGHDYSFSWADFGSNFETTAPRQFIVRAGGGVGFNTNSLHFGTDDVIIAPRSGGDADADLAFTTPSGKYGRVYLSNGDGRLNLFGDGGVHIYNPVGIDGALDAKSLNIEGSASKSTAGAWKANSDGRIKQDIEPVEDALDTLGKLRPVTFHYTDAYRANHAGVDGQRYYNVIAQQFAQVFPDAVSGSGEYLEGVPKTPENEILQVDTYPAQIVTIAAVQELARKNAAQQASIERLLARIEKLEAARGK